MRPRLGRLSDQAAADHSSFVSFPKNPAALDCYTGLLAVLPATSPPPELPCHFSFQKTERRPRLRGTHTVWDERNKQVINYITRDARCSGGAGSRAWWGLMNGAAVGGVAWSDTRLQDETLELRTEGCIGKQVLEERRPKIHDFTSCVWKNY